MDQAQAVAEAIASTPTSAVLALTIGVEVPLGALLGRGFAGLAAMDLSQARGRGGGCLCGTREGYFTVSPGGVAHLS